MKRYTIAIVIVCAIVSAITSCDKVSGTGILIGASGVNDRVTQSQFIFKNDYDDRIDIVLKDTDAYSFMIGADSHIATDTGRICEMFADALDPNKDGNANDHDLFIAHLGDLADTQPEPYNLTYKAIDYWYAMDNATIGDTIPFYPVVGNHDITHNGWSYFQRVIQVTTYVFNVVIPSTGKRDVFVFMDTASGTHGDNQLDLVENLINADNAQYGNNIRNIFFFGHTNYFRGTTGNVQFSSTFAREELYSMLKYFHDWQDNISGKVTVFTGHNHEYGYWEYGGVNYYNLDSMSERNSPEIGDYLEHVSVGSDGLPRPERYTMYYTVKNWRDTDITIEE